MFMSDDQSTLHITCFAIAVQMQILCCHGLYIIFYKKKVFANNDDNNKRKNSAVRELVRHATCDKKV